MTLETLVIVAGYIIVAFVVALVMTKAVPPHGWYERLSTAATGIVWPLSMIMGVILFLQMLEEDARGRRRLRASERIEALEWLARELTKGCGSGMWVIQNRHNKLLPQWEACATSAEADIRHALALTEADYEASQKTGKAT